MSDSGKPAAPAPAPVPEEPQLPEQFAPEKLEKYPVWTCSIEKLGPEFPDVEKWTVGDKFRLSCKGPSKTPFAGKAAILFPQEQFTYSLVILQTLRDENEQVDFLISGYKPGQMKAPVLLITDGQQILKVENLSWNVNTVIEAKQGEKTEPFPMYGPFKIAWPLWLWGVLLGVGLILMGVLYLFLRRQARRRRLLESLDKYQTAISPYNAFNKDIRQILRKYEGKKDPTLPPQYLKDLDESFRLYLIRQLRVPALDWQSGQILREIRSRHRRVFYEHGRDIKTLFRELEKAKSADSALRMQDCDQIRDMSRRLANQIYAVEKGRA